MNSEGSLSYILSVSIGSVWIRKLASPRTGGTLCPMAYDLEAMLMRVMGWNDDLNAGFATMREMKVMVDSDKR